MSGKKYKIEQNEKFLGHWTAHTPQEAIYKMLNSNYPDCYYINPNESFVVTKGEKTETIKL